jgi:hypothetical protein
MLFIALTKTALIRIFRCFLGGIKNKACMVREFPARGLAGRPAIKDVHMSQGSWDLASLKEQDLGTSASRYHIICDMNSS